MHSIPANQGQFQPTSNQNLSIEPFPAPFPARDSAREKPRSGLDLSFGHLRTTTPQYIPVSVSGHVHSLENWYRPAGQWTVDDHKNMVATIQPLKAGGYELLIKGLCLPDIAKTLDIDRQGGKRDNPEGQTDESKQRSKHRAKKKCRLLIKSMGCDRLVTLTRRESEGGEYWTQEQWAKAWKRFCRVLREKLGIELDYVATMESHKKGNFHMHIAINKRINVNHARAVWCAICGGKGCGNVDISFKHHKSIQGRLSGLAKYISKYITKQFEASDFNKKRYFSSKHDLPEKVRIVLSAGDIQTALAEVCGLLQLDQVSVVGLKRDFFVFPDLSGFWLSWNPEIQRGAF